MTDPAPKSQQQRASGAYQTLYGCPEGQDARILAERARACMRDDSVLIHIVTDDARLATLKDLLKFFAPDVKVAAFPAWDCLPYDRVSPGGELVAQRMATLYKLLSWQKTVTRNPRILLTTMNAATQRVPPQEFLSAVTLRAEAGKPLNLENFITRLNENGYQRSDTVREAGEYALRGGILDLFPSGYGRPLRLDFFGDEVETIRAFDPDTQTSLKDVQKFTLTPAREVTLNGAQIETFRKNYRALFGVGRAPDPLYEHVSEGRPHNGMEHWLPLFYDRLETLFDYAPGARVTLDAQAPQVGSERLEQVRDFYQARKTLEASQTQKKSKDVSLSGSTYHPLAPEALYIDEEEWAECLPAESMLLSPFPELAEHPAAPENASAAQKGRDFTDIRALPDGDLLGEVKRHLLDLQTGRSVLIAFYSPGSRDRLSAMMEAAGITNLRAVDGAEDLKKLKTGEVGLGILPLAHGFTAPDLAVLSEQDIFGDRLTRRSKKKKADNFLREVSSLTAGDLVVHQQHGIGRFEGLETLNAAGTIYDCLKILYADDDRLFVPVVNIEVLSRFGHDEGTVQLDKMGGAAWQARKSKVKKDLMRIAGKLMEVAAARQLRKADSLHIEKEAYDHFAARFPYAETEDQARSINAVLQDLAGTYPMDRLVCGDVGFGKTEVAIRAAYVAAKAGVQVALVVPTTLLARQHYAEFMRRFDGTGLRIAQLSRMVSPKEAEKIRKDLSEGHVDIIIGTHALFANRTQFAHLGLLIIDEEQRFGVKQKEKLKELKADVHVLTLTATPIPRTLQLSLSGVRELSLITTPPVDRLAIRTFVLPFDPVVIREALLREHHRGGQSFYVCPRISDLETVQETLKDLVPELKTVTAHGRMAATDLDARMTAFYDGQYDILLATNIIESGIDIPSANTMVVHRADMFGLAQLYQIRGRIGRSKQRAYAYLSVDPKKKLTDQGQKRLEVIATLDTLGAGFQLASHDMDIRGAGNLLGEEQSGHVREVGIELYQQMLEEAVVAAKSGVDMDDLQNQSDWSPQINLGLSMLIPELYVPDLGVRMTLYRRLSDLETSAEIERFAAELIDRFGVLPEEVENLLETAKIKQLCRLAGIDRLEAGPKGAVFGFYMDQHAKPEMLLKWMEERRTQVKLRPDQRISLSGNWENPKQRLKPVRRMMKELAALAE